MFQKSFFKVCILLYVSLKTAPNLVLISWLDRFPRYLEPLSLAVFRGVCVGVCVYVGAGL